MNQVIEQVLFDQQTIQKRVAELGAQISNDYQGKDLLLLGILRGCVLFMSDLMRQITIPCEIDFMSASSYGFGTESTGAVTIRQDISTNPREKNILIIEDILDTGITLSHIKPALEQRGAASVQIAALLDKPSRRKMPIELDYCGFSIPNHFVIGYGMDYKEKCRNVPYIGILKESEYTK